MEMLKELLKSLDYKEYSQVEYKSKSSSVNYQDILRELADGYNIEELPERGIKPENLEIFKRDLADNNLTVENLKAINQYSNGSNMILGVKRNLVEKSTIRQNIHTQLNESLQARGLNKETIDNISNYINDLDYSKPLHENYDILRNNIDSLDLPGSSKASMFTATKNMNNLNHIDETINSLDDALSKSYINESVKVYRALKGVPEESLTNMVGKSFNNKGYTSTTPVYESSFAKYDEYNTVIEMNIPKGTQGIDITRFSDYDSVENEILLNDNDLTVFETKKGIIDKNEKSKNIIKGYALSKDRSGYENLEEKNMLINKSDTNAQSFKEQLKTSVCIQEEITKNYIAREQEQLQQQIQPSIEQTQIDMGGRQL